MRKGIIISETLDYEIGDVVEVYTAQEASELEPAYKSYFYQTEGCESVVGFSTYKGETGGFYGMSDSEVDFEAYKEEFVSTKEIRSVKEIKKEIERIKGILSMSGRLSHGLESRLETLKWVLKEEEE